MFLLFLLPAIFNVNDADWVTVNATDAYKDMNSKYKVKWDVNLENEALELAKNPATVRAHILLKENAKAYKFVKGKEYFKKGDLSSMYDKVTKTLKTNINARWPEFARFKSGTLFGCNGIFNTTSHDYDFVSSVCLYKRPY